MQCDCTSKFFCCSHFSRALFSFHGCLFRFFSRVGFLFFTGVFLTKFSRAKNAFHAHFFVTFQNFSREAFPFSRAKSRNIDFFSREPFHVSRPKKKKTLLGPGPQPRGQIRNKNVGIFHRRLFLFPGQNREI